MPHYFSYGCLGDTTAEEKACPDRWRAQADAQIHNHDYAEMERVHSEAFNDRQKNRRENQNSRRHVHKGADREQYQIYNQQYYNFVGSEPEQRRAYILRDVLVSKEPAHRHGGRDKNHDDGGGDRTLQNYCRQVFDFYFAVNDNGKYKRINNSDGGGLGCREDTPQNTAENNDNQKQGGDGFYEPFEGLAKGEFLSLAIVSFSRNYTGNEHKGQSHKYPRQDTGDEHGSDRAHAACGERINNHYVAGRNQQPRSCRGYTDGSIEVTVVAHFIHNRDHEPPYRRYSGSSGTGDGTEEHAGHYVYESQSSAEPPDENIGKID